MTKTLTTGHILAVEGNPFDDQADDAARWHEALLIEGGRIAARCVDLGLLRNW